MELHFGTIWEPRAAKIDKKRGPKTGPEKGRPQECPGPFETLRAEPRRGVRWEVNLPPWGFGGSERFGRSEDERNKKSKPCKEK